MAESSQLDDDDLAENKAHGNTLMMKLLGPIVTFVDRPWKMYPVGVLFGLGASPVPRAQNSAAHENLSLPIFAPDLYFLGQASIRRRPSRSWLSLRLLNAVRMASRSTQAISSSFQ